VNNAADPTVANWQKARFVMAIAEFTVFLNKAMSALIVYLLKSLTIC
jgi:hypothetical protein